MHYKKLIKAVFVSHSQNTTKIKTLLYIFTLLAANALSPQATVAQEKPSADEIVVGFGTIKKRNLTGSVTEVNVKDVAKAPVYSFTEALGGRAGGLQVSAADGQPGAAMNIQIRNLNSLFQHNAPLFVIDGIITPDFQAAALNPDDIETLNILKDAAATTIYGTLASNGVVLIKTKKGHDGQPVFSFNNALGFQDVTKKMELMSPHEFVKYQEELNASRTAARYFSNGKTLANYQNEEGIDWQDLIFRRSLVRMHNLSLSGGSSTNKYYISGSNFDQEGVITSSDAKKHQIRVAVDQIVTDKLTIGFNANYSKLSNSGQLVAAQSGNFYSFFNSRVWGYRPVAGNNYDLLNSEYDIDASDNFAYRLNPVLLNKKEQRKNESSDLFASANLDYAITQDFTFRSTGSLINRKFEISTSHAYTGSPVAPNEYITSTRSTVKNDRNYWTNDNTLTFDKVFNEDYQLNVLAGFAIRGEKSEYNNYSFSNEINSGKNFRSEKFEHKSYFGRFIYGYQSKYFLEGSYRADKSSAFSTVNHRSSGSFAWNMHREDFLKNLTTLSESKFRMSYGKEKGFYRKSEQYNAGYDLGLFNHRLALNVDVYQRTLENYSFDASYPLNNTIQNPGFNSQMPTEKLRNRGLEFNLNTINVRSSSFSWQTNFNINFSKNKILQLSGNREFHRFYGDIDTRFNSQLLYEARVDQSAGAIYGLVFDGVYQYTDFNQSGSGAYTLKDNVPYYGGFPLGIRPGDVKYKDINGDGLLNTDDAGTIGNGLPLHTGGFLNNFTYKNFDLNIFFQWSYGNDIYNANRLFFEGNALRVLDLNQFASYTNRWTPENPTNENYRAGGPEYFHSSRVVEDGSYLRLKTASLAYNVPQKLINKLHLTKLQLHVTGQNLLTFTKYTGMDPEVSVRNHTQMPGVDMSAYPQARTLMFGINASF
jgi:TonB-dependent SusC/RagA subfamily outer membrane receptor